MRSQNLLVNTVYITSVMLFAVTFVIFSDLSFTWLALLCMTLIALSFSIWFGNIKDVLFCAVVFSSSINLSKAVIAEGGVYTPGLSIFLIDLFWIPLLCFWLIEKKVFLKQAIFWSPLHIVPLLFLLWLWLTIFFSHDTQAAVLMCVNYTKYFLIFVLLADYINSVHHIRLFLLAFAAGICCHFLIAMLEVVAGGSVFVQGAKTTTLGTKLVFEGAGGVHAFRPSGLAGHPNALADVLTFFMPILFGLILSGARATGQLIRLLSIAFFLVCGIFLILTLSRAGWISLTCGCMFMVYFAYKDKVLSKQTISFLAGLAVVGALIAVLIFPTIYLRITESDQRSGESRIAMMHQSALIIKNNPVVGVGIAGYNRAARNNIPEYFSHLSIYFQEDLLKGVVHNKYLLVMSETGIIGIILFLIFMYQYCSIPIKVKKWPDRTYYFLALGVSAGIFSQIIFYLFDHFYADNRITMFYLYMGLLVALLKLRAQYIATLATSETVPLDA